ncbi:hypothetical protein BD770DRAFT_449902 [Pilaira anomala]|nr:hypothetical protein BD770DRAFT_449902 [Pilaira anomala]
MNSSTNNTAFKRRAIRADEEEEEFFEQEQAEEVSNEVMQPTTSNNLQKKARRGRPSKKNMAVAEASGSGTTIANPDSQSTGASSTTDIELEQAFDALSRRSRSSTVMAYRMPFEHWKNFCDNNRHRYPVDPLYPYTVGPIEFVVAFFKEFVFKRTYMKNVSVVTDVRTQIGLRTEQNADSQLDLLQMAEDAPSNRKGNKKIIEVPVGIEVVKQYKKVLMFLHEYQSSCREVGYTSPKDIKELTELIKKYQHDLIYDEVQTNADRSSHCVIRDSYKSGELIRILKNLWIASKKSSIREMFAISSRHHMLLRDQDLRNLNFSNCFCTIIPKQQHKGMQQAVAFLLQENGDFLHGDRWQFWKVLRGRFDPESSLSTTSQWQTAKEVLEDEEVFTSRVTHGGRHSGAMEAEALGIPVELIKKGGGWKDKETRLETHYLGKLPAPFARGMAGFWGKPFALARNSVSPSLELQKTIFPWIESYSSVNNKEWGAACNKEMNEIDDNKDEEANILNMVLNNEVELEEHVEEVEFVEEDGRTKSKKKDKGKGKQRAVQSRESVMKRGFLRLLLRCRRIVLQDAAVYLHLNRQNKLVNSKNALFSGDQFKEFQKEVIAAAASPSISRLEEYEGLVPNLVDTHKDVSRRVAEANQRIASFQQQYDNRSERFESSLENHVVHSNQQNVMLMNMTQQLAKDLQILIMQQQIMNSQIQLLMASNNNASQSTSNQANFTFPAAPQIQAFPTITSQQPVVIHPAPPMPLTRQQPVVIHSSPSPTNNSNSATASPKPKTKTKKKTRWVSYKPDSSE